MSRPIHHPREQGHTVRGVYHEDEGPVKGEVYYFLGLGGGPEGHALS